MKSIFNSPILPVSNAVMALMICLSLMSCSKEAGSNTPDETVAANLGYIASEKGMELTYTVIGSDGLERSYTAKVTDVKDENGYRVAYVQLLVNEMLINSSGRFNKKETISDGANMPTIYYETLDQLKKAYNSSFTHQENPMTLVIPHQNPINKVVGQAKTLTEWHGVNIDENSKIVADYTMERSDVIIAGRETIETTAGKFDCLKMAYTATATTKFESTDLDGVVTHFDNVGVIIITMWVAKGIGTVKTTEAAGGAVTTTELTKVEK